MPGLDSFDKSGFPPDQDNDNYLIRRSPSQRDTKEMPPLSMEFTSDQNSPPKLKDDSFAPRDKSPFFTQNAGYFSSKGPLSYSSDAKSSDRAYFDVVMKKGYSGWQFLSIPLLSMTNIVIGTFLNA